MDGVANWRGEIPGREGETPDAASDGYPPPYFSGSAHSKEF